MESLKEDNSRLFGGIANMATFGMNTWNLHQTAFGFQIEAVREYECSYGGRHEVFQWCRPNGCP